VKRRELVAKHREAILALAAEHGLADVRLFGSVARGDEDEESDIDFLVRRLPGSDPFELLDFKEAIEALLGCKVDLLTEHPWMRPRLKKNIERDLQPL
jgi:predicted nucleotidyltransferase